MARTERPSGRAIPRREFIRGSVAAALTGGSALASSPAPGGKQKVAPHSDYSTVIETIERTLPVAMSQRDITVVWSKGFDYTNRAQKEKVTSETLFHVSSIPKSFTPEISSNS